MSRDWRVGFEIDLLLRLSVTSFLFRYLTDANLGGIEKLTICEMLPEYGCMPPHNMATEEMAPEHGVGLLAPMQAFMIKGWTRSQVAHTLLLAPFECPEFKESWPKALQQYLEACCACFVYC